MPKPNARGKAALLIIAAIIFLVVGFVCGQIVKALTTLPGDADDPVATQSYVETQLGERLATLTTRLEEVEAELAALKGGSTTNQNNTNQGTTNNPGGTTTNQGSTTNLGSTSTSGKTVRITGSSVNVRRGPGTNYERVGSMSRGDTATLLGTEGTWYRIQTGNITGYVSTEYASVQ